MPTFDKIINLFEATPWFNAISMLLAVIGVLIGFIFYFRAKRVRLPTYAIRNFNIVKDKVERINEVEVCYQKDKIENLSISRIAIWNAGRETINPENMAPADLLRITSGDGVRILDVRILYEKNKANNFSLDIPSQNEVLIKFDYFDLYEGIILQIYHTGKTEDDIKVHGSVKGAGSIQKIRDPFVVRLSSPTNLENVKKSDRRMVLGLMLFFTPIIPMLAELISQLNFGNKLLSKYVPTLIILILYWTAAFSVLRKRIPHGYELFEDEINP